MCFIAISIYNVIDVQCDSISHLFTARLYEKIKNPKRAVNIKFDGLQKMNKSKE